MIREERIREMLEEVGSDVHGWDVAWTVLSEELQQSETELDYDSEPPDGFVFSKEDVAGFCRAAHVTGQKFAYKEIYNHLPFHADVEDLRKCLFEFMSEHLKIKFEMATKDPLLLMLEQLLGGTFVEIDLSEPS